MRKFIKIILSVFSLLILSAIIIPVVLSVVMSVHSVQNYAVGKAASMLSDYLGTTVRIDKIDIKLFNRVVIDGFYSEDFNGDTLIYAGLVDVGFRGYNPVRNVLRLGDVTLCNAVLNLRQDSTQTSNLAAVLAKLKREEKRERKRNFTLRGGNINVMGMRFSMKKYEIPERPYGTNFADLDIEGVQLEIDRFILVKDRITARIKSLTFEEKGGFECREFFAENVEVSPQRIKLSDFKLRDEYSRINMSEFAMLYDDWIAFKTFTDDVALRSDMENCLVDFNTIALFAPKLLTWDLKVWIPQGRVDGPVVEMKGFLRDAAVKNTVIDVDFIMEGLPDTDNANFNFILNRLVTEDEDINDIYTGIKGKDLDKVMPYIDGLGNINLNGNFKGSFADFYTEGTLITDSGDLIFDLETAPSAQTGNNVKGSVYLDNLHIGNILGSDNLGETTMEAKINGIITADDLSIYADAFINSLIFNGYEYKDIDFDGNIRKNYYEGKIISYDRNAELEISGIFDFTDELPDYEFDLNITHADLKKLNLNKRDSTAVLSLGMELNAVGVDVDDIRGYGVITGLHYIFNSDTVRSERVHLLAENTEHNKMIALYSDIMDVELHTRLSYVDMIPYFKRTLSKYVSSFSMRIEEEEELESKLRPGVTSTVGDYYIAKAYVKENRNFVSAIIPNLKVSEGTNLSFIFNPLSEDFSVMFESDLVEYGNMYASGLKFTNMNQSDSIAVYLRTQEFGMGNFYMPDFSLNGGAKDNQINLSAGFKNDINNTSALINSVSRTMTDSLSGENMLATRIYSSRLVVGDYSWRVSTPEILFGNGKIGIDWFRVQSSGQELAVDGVISSSQSDTLRVTMNNFNLAPLSALVDRFGFGLSGYTNGYADITAVSGDRLFYSEIDLNDVVVNDRSLPDSRFHTVWDNEQERILVSLSSDGRDKMIDGYYVPRGKNYFVIAEFPDTDLVFLSPFLDGILKDIEGKAHTKLYFTGTGGKPIINGTIGVENFSAVVDFTNVPYTMNNETVEIVDNNIYLNEGVLYDPNGGEARVDMTLTTTYLANMNYDIRIYPENLMAVNTTADDNDIFYGRVFASGVVGIKGNKRKVNMDIYASSEANSRIVIPVGDAASISEADFIYFRQPSDTMIRSEATRREELRNRMRSRRPESRSDLEIDISMNITPGLEVRIQLDQDNKNEINGKGIGLIDMKIRPNESLFTISGDYEITEGTYDFSIPNLPASKQFSIESGSHIQWTGNPLDAILDIQTIYKLRASIAPLMGAERGAYRQNVPVECVILLTDRLTQPTINFDVRVPTADTEIQSVVQNAMNTQEMKSTQFIWLLATNSFYMDNNLTNNIGTVATVSTGVEFLTNQLSNWVSNDRLRFNFGYRPKSEMSSDEIDFSYSQEIIPNKLLIEAEANYNLGNNQATTINNNVNQLTGDFYITYIFDRIGNLRARAFTRTIDRFDENQGLQESGVGLYYKKDFDSFSELFRRKRRNKTDD
ncbi:MAG: translocation/assembly module TamB [Rikenellaceae bacterium]|nr:translocation/assembly module TamB [Rikenellaceae bacterium]